ncbi:13904_t:CDS:2 [Acaulospora morrowiae]|uniref:13904_t:CDS:1 n=1 Tax=Acaulospora morrowiae TaxID=94023 RepID=A0A9N8ZVB0_9GLOM|nr:13904_t:CDS:2 [Acaulospora morrowiae]
MLPTPNLDHLSSEDYEKVYNPAAVSLLLEDTFLFLDTLEDEVRFIKDDIKPCICLEIGSGTGCISTFLGQILGNGSTHINPHATATTIATGHRNSVLLDAITTDLTSGLLPRLNHAVDVICCNPPYVVTPHEDVHSKNILERSWAGGINGREVIDQILPLVNNLLSKNGVFYLLVINENMPDEICEKMRKEHQFQSEVVKFRLAGREKQYILKFKRCIDN